MSWASNNSSESRLKKSVLQSKSSSWIGYKARTRAIDAIEKSTKLKFSKNFKNVSKNVLEWKI